MAADVFVRLKLRSRFWAASPLFRIWVKLRLQEKRLHSFWQHSFEIPDAGLGQLSIGVQSGPPIGVQKGPLCRGADRLMLGACFALLAT
jgi:hypothetical protein